MPAQSSVRNRAANALVDATKRWFATLDPTGTKLSAYRRGIRSGLGFVQLLGMTAPRPLRDVYVNLKFLDTPRKFLPPDSLLSEEDRNNEYRVSRAIGLDREIERSSSRSFLRDLANEYEPADVDLLEDEYLPEVDVDPSPKDFPEDNDAPPVVADCHDVAAALEAIDNGHRFLLLGQAGSGKTTFLKYLALAYSTFVSAPVPLRPLLPVFVPLQFYSRSQSIEDCVTRSMLRMVSRSDKLSWASGFMQRGRCIFLFDGLDEVERPLYRKCTEQLHDFQQHYRDNRFVVACRSASYTGDFEGSTLCEIADLDRSSAYRLIRAYFGTETGNAGDLIGELENNRSALDLTRSPLLATMLCIQYDLGYTIPKRRNSLYAELLDTLMFKWDVQKRVRRASRHPSVGRQTIKRILSRIARRTFEAHAVYFQRRNVLRWVAEELCMLGGSSVEASDLLEDIERNTGLVVERAAGVLSVAHTTFQEYLSAVAYVEERLEHEVAEHHLYDRRYGDIIVMIAESLPNADAFIRHIVGKVVRELVQQGIESDEVWEVLTRLGRAEVAMARQLRGLLADVAVDVLAADVE